MKPVIFRNETNKIMMNQLENIESIIKDQHLKQNESLKKISMISNIEDNELIILEKLQRMEEKTNHIWNLVIKGELMDAKP